MSAAWTPRIDCIGGADDAKWGRADAIIARLGARVRDIGGGSWRLVEEFDVPTRDAAVAAIERILDGIDPDWRDVLRVIGD